MRSPPTVQRIGRAILWATAIAAVELVPPIALEVGGRGLMLIGRGFKAVGSGFEFVGDRTMQHAYRQRLRGYNNYDLEPRYQQPRQSYRPVPRQPVYSSYRES